jgi:hypothetical protein
MQQVTLGSKPSTLDALFDARQILALNRDRPTKNPETQKAARQLVRYSATTN